MSNNLDIRHISCLGDTQSSYNLTFFIPSQQRGYRWRTENIIDLLQDLSEFLGSNQTNYCLQPLAIINKGNNEYEVLDGQQRLTTLYLMFKSLDIPCPYRFKFERDISNERIFFLENDILEKNDNDSIDIFFMRNAFKRFKDYWESRKDEKTKFKDLLTDRCEKKHIIFLWYQVPEINKHETFRNLNSGKIALSNSDLIKALLLSDSSIIENKLLAAKQFEDVQKMIENDRFWYMLQKNEYRINGEYVVLKDPCKDEITPFDKMRRIDFIFNLATKTTLEEYQNDPLISFRKVAKDYSNNADSIITFWKNTQDLFTILLDFYNNVVIYHYIGYLTYCRETNYDSIRDIIELYQNEDKKDFINKLKSSLIIGDNKKRHLPENLEEINYETTSKSMIVRVLMLHNIETILEAYKKKSLSSKLKLQDSSEYFPFDLFYRQSWDIEHIASQTDNPLKSQKDRKEWVDSVFSDHKELLNKEELNNLRSKFLETKEHEEQIFLELKKKVENEVTNNSVVNKHGIGNLVLLDSKTNRSFHNDLFPSKRKKVILSEIISDNSNDVVYIPNCTRKVFMKYYNTSTSLNMLAWEQTDFEMYQKDIKEKLNEYFKD